MCGGFGYASELIPWHCITKIKTQLAKGGVYERKILRKAFGGVVGSINESLYAEVEALPFRYRFLQRFVLFKKTLLEYASDN